MLNLLARFEYEESGVSLRPRRPMLFSPPTYCPLFLTKVLHPRALAHTHTFSRSVIAVSTTFVLGILLLILFTTPRGDDSEEVDFEVSPRFPSSSRPLVPSAY